MKHKFLLPGETNMFTIGLIAAWSLYALWISRIWPAEPDRYVIFGAIVNVGAFLYSIWYVQSSRLQQTCTNAKDNGTEVSIPEEKPERQVEQHVERLPEGPVRLENWNVTFHMPNMGPEGAGFKLNGSVYGDPDFDEGTEITTGRFCSVIGKIVHIRGYFVILGTPSKAFLDEHPDFDAERPLQHLANGGARISFYDNFDEIARQGWNIPKELTITAEQLREHDETTD